MGDLENVPTQGMTLRTKFFLASGLAIIILLIFNTILFGGAAFDEYFVQGLMAATALLTCRRYDAKLKGIVRLIWHVMLIMVSLAGWAFLLILTGYTLISLPKTPPYNQRIVPPQVSIEERAGYSYFLDYVSPTEAEPHYQVLGDAFVGQKTDSSAVEQALAAVDSLNNTFLETLATEPFSFHGLDHPNMPLPHFLHIQNVYKAECILLGRLVNTDMSQAARRSLRLWRVLDNYLAGEQTLIQTTAGFVLAGITVQGHLNHFPNLALQADDSLFFEIETVRARLTDALKSACKNEALSLTTAFQSAKAPENLTLPDSDNTSLFGGTLKQVFRQTRLTDWPFFDSDKTNQAIEDYFFELIALCNLDFYISAEKLHTLSMTLEQEYRYPLLHSNPLGNILLSIALPNFAGATERKEEARARLTMLLFLLQNKGQADIAQPPLDNLTGQPFQVEATPGSLRIWTLKANTMNGLDLKTSY